MKIIGIDPGMKGAVVVIQEGAEPLITPMLPTVTLVDWLIASRCCSITDPALCFIEQAQSFPGQGIVGTFNYGKGFGEIIGVLTALRIPYEMVRPHVWTKAMLAGTTVPRSEDKKLKKDKTRSIDAARRLFPGVEEMRRLKPRDGICEALLIAEYGRRFRLGGTA